MMFESVIGQDRLKALLANAMAKNQISHAYLFIGARGIGKTYFALQFAQAILCTAPDRMKRPCGHCQSCEHFLTNSHPDLIRVAPEEGARTIKIAQIRRLLATAATRTYDGGNRVFIIEHGETMTTESQNALLKSLEEPEPGNVFLILTENVSKILPTIRSRCQRLSLEPLTDAQMQSVLKAHGVSESDSQQIIENASGLPGKALALAGGDDDETLNHEAFDTVCDILNGNQMIIFDFAKKIAAAAGGGMTACESLIAVTAAALEVQYGIASDNPSAQKLAKLADADTLIQMQAVLFELSKRLTANVNSRIQWEAALLKISEL